MQRYVIADEFGRRVNTILWDGEATLSLGTGYFLYLESEFVPPLNEGSPYHEWNGTEYALNPDKVAAAKEAVWEQIKAYRDDVRNMGGFPVGPYWFHSDAPSKIDQLGLTSAVMMGALPVGKKWKLMDGSKVTLTTALVQQIFGSAMTRRSANFDKAEEHRVLMEASEDPLNYDFTTGWPPIFGE